jgi:uncharacterized protein (DUF1697 family)
VSTGSELGVGLVRGINVGPTTAVAMTDLAASFEAAGFSGVRTLLRSGNVVFEAPGVVGAPGDDGAEAVAPELAKRSGVSAKVLVLPEREFRRIAAENPLLDAGDDFSKQVVTFLGAEPMPAALEVPPRRRSRRRWSLWAVRRSTSGALWACRRPGSPHPSGVS